MKVLHRLVSNCPLPILLGHHSAIPREVSDGHPKTIKVSMHCQDMKEPNPCHALCLLLWYNMPSSPQLEDGAFEIIEGWPASSQRRHLRFKLCSSQFLDGDPGPIIIFEAGGTECFRTLAEKSGRFFPLKSLFPKIFKGPTSSQTYFVVLEAWLNLASFWIVKTQACLKGVWRRAPAFSLEGWPIKCQCPVSCLRIYRCEPGSNAELRHGQGASLFPDVFSKLDTCTHLDSKHLDLRLLW